MTCYDWGIPKSLSVSPVHQFSYGSLISCLMSALAPANVCSCTSQMSICALARLYILIKVLLHQPSICGIFYKPHSTHISFLANQNAAGNWSLPLGGRSGITFLSLFIRSTTSRPLRLQKRLVSKFGVYGYEPQQCSGPRQVI